jgi:hypothetical protein
VVECWVMAATPIRKLAVFQIRTYIRTVNGMTGII